MRIMKFAIIGAALAVGVNYLLQRREDGTSLFEEITGNAPEFMDKVKDLAVQAIDKVSANIKS